MKGRVRRTVEEETKMARGRSEREIGGNCKEREKRREGEERNMGKGGE